jgi:hypothetical protein
VFDYGQTNSADQMRTSWEKLVEYVGTTYGQDISNELQNKQVVTIAEPQHTPEVMARHAQREQMIRTGQENIRRACLTKQTLLEAEVIAAIDSNAPLALAILRSH